MEARVLQQAIYASNPSHAKLVLMKLCRDNPSARRYIESEMLIEELDGGQVRAAAAPAEQPSKKRARYAVCAQCEQPFDETRNEDLTCCQPHHPGIMVENFAHSGWDDMREDMELCSPAQYRDPESFDWTCCGRPGNAEGCQVKRRHVASTAWLPDASTIPPAKKTRRA
ncbi:hypothetical protein M011DRAFT_480706 [Neofusicoccum parvum]|uniref:Uncharacterized protein n=1 Tax=Neofusicoccum parvum TaxID=310453 RepID=A0ACB5RYG1_9PEZI|nr:hypothetical protein M011DRAFT_480706 [Neofusicoccum parvum]